MYTVGNVALNQQNAQKIRLCIAKRPTKHPFYTATSHLSAYAGNNPVKYVDPDGRDITNKTNDYIVARLENPIILSNDVNVDTVVLAPNDKYIGDVDGTKDKNGDYTKISALEGDSINYTIQDGNKIVFDDKKSERTNNRNDTMKKINNLPLINLVKGKKLLSGSYSKDSNGGKFLSKEWDEDFKEDLGEAMFDEAYNSDTQKKIREEHVVSGAEK